MRKNKQLLAVLALSGLIGVVQADEKDELLNPSLTSHLQI